MIFQVEYLKLSKNLHILYILYILAYITYISFGFFCFLSLFALHAIFMHFFCFMLVHLCNFFRFVKGNYMFIISGVPLCPQHCIRVIFIFVVFTVLYYIADLQSFYGCGPTERPKTNVPLRGSIKSILIFLMLNFDFVKFYSCLKGVEHPTELHPKEKVPLLYTARSLLWHWKNLGTQVSNGLKRSKVLEEAYCRTNVALIYYNLT